MQATQNSDASYKRQSIIHAFISIESAAAVACAALFWVTIPRFETDSAATEPLAADVKFGPHVHDEAMALPPGVLLQQGQREKALKAATELIQREKFDVKANLCAGYVFIAVGDTTGGLQYLKKAVSLARRNRYVREDYAENLQQAGHRDEAIVQFEALANAYPEWQEPHLALARLYMDADRPADAAVQFKKVLESDEHNYAARRLRGICLSRAGKSAEGLSEYMLATTQEAQSGIPQAIKTILGDKGRDAIDRVTYELQQQVDQKPDEYVPKLRLAQLYQYIGTPDDLAQAKDLLMQARRLQPNNVEVHRTLSVVLKQSGENENQAISEFAQSVKLEATQEKRAEEAKS